MNNVIISKDAPVNYTKIWDDSQECYCITIRPIVVKIYNELLARLTAANFAPITLKMKPDGFEVIIDSFIEDIDRFENGQLSLHHVKWFVVTATKETAISADNLLDVAAFISDFNRIHAQTEKEIDALDEFYKTNIKGHTVDEQMLGKHMLLYIYENWMWLAGTFGRPCIVPENLEDEIMENIVNHFHVPKDKCIKFIRLAQHWSYYVQKHLELYHCTPITQSNGCL